MKLFSKKPPWYATGLAFECQQCGRCCAGPAEGYVWVDESDIEAIATFLKLSVEEMRDRWVRKVGGRYSLKEAPVTRDCIFLRPNDQGGRGCAIYPVRPIQCHTWPFWKSNLTNPNCWAQAQRRCIGINRGKVHAQADIEKSRDATRE